MLYEVITDRFSVALIPHTLQVTTLGRLQPGDPVNLETDLLASRTQAPEHRGRLVQPRLSRETKKSRPQSTAEEGGQRDEVLD